MAARRSILSLPLPKDVISALSSAGYTNLGDLVGCTAESLAKDIKIEEDAAHRVLNFLEETLTVPLTMPMTQSVAILAQSRAHISTSCNGLDKLLGGGLQCGHILEVSGPPGSPKDRIACNIAIEHAQHGGNVLIIDCQNMVDLRALQRALSPESLKLVRYKRIISLAELLLLFEQLELSQDTLLVISSISFPFQSFDISPARRSVLLQKVRQVLARVTSNLQVTAITTSQLATKIVNSDGTVGNFDTGVQGIMVPQLGSLYLPSGRSWKIVLAPDSLTSGNVRLLSSPASQQESAVEPYTLASFVP